MAFGRGALVTSVRLLLLSLLASSPAELKSSLRPPNAPLPCAASLCVSECPRTGLLSAEAPFGLSASSLELSSGSFTPAALARPGSLTPAWLGDSPVLSAGALSPDFLPSSSTDAAAESFSCALSGADLSCCCSIAFQSSVSSLSLSGAGAAATRSSASSSLSFSGNGAAAARSLAPDMLAEGSSSPSWEAHDTAASLLISRSAHHTHSARCCNTWLTFDM